VGGKTPRNGGKTGYRPFKTLVFSTYTNIIQEGRKKVKRTDEKSVKNLFQRGKNPIFTDEKIYSVNRLKIQK
jgi:hypothetical protein